MSYVEIYMERIRCLLDRQQQKNNLEIRVDLNRGVYVDGATELEVQSDAELLRVAAEGSAMRHVVSIDALFAVRGVGLISHHRLPCP